MSHNSQNSKSILARALATENIRVEHNPTAHTAMFDVANRVLVLPAWKDMSDELRDMLIGHEVAHALFTPYREVDKKVEGAWSHDAERIGGNVHAPYVQGLLNIVEDIRIEKMIKEKYPGLRRDFVMGYKELENRDFFGTKGVDLSTLSFGDRLNIHFKCGSSMNIPFSAEEMEIVTKVDQCKSFDDVINMTEEIFKFINGRRCHINMEKEQTPVSISTNGNNGEENNSPSNTTINVPVNFISDPNGIQGGNGNNSSNEKSNESSSGEGNKKEDKKDNPSTAMGTDKAGNGLAPNVTSFMPPLVTQKKFEESQKDLIDKTVGSIKYCTLGKPMIKNIVLPHVKTNKILSDHFSVLDVRGSHLVKKIRENFVEFTRNTNPLIQTLIKQFEMKKAADIQKRTSISRSGKIDCDRIFKYKVSDDIFLRCSKIAEGKNHGLVMYVDWSASMQHTIGDVLSQINILARFCKQMNIPFDVYLFSSQYTVLCDHLNIDRNNMYNSYDKFNHWKDGIRCSIKSNTKYKNYDAPIYNGEAENFALIHVLSGEMNKRQFNEALFNVFCLGQMITRPENTRLDKLQYVSSSVPNDFNLGNTPLDSTVMAAIEMVPEFQKKHKLQIVNTIFLTDGESGYSPFTVGWGGDKTYVKHYSSNKEYTADDSTPTDTLLRIFRDMTGSTTIGFFICGSTSCRYFVDSQIDRKTMKDDGFFEAPSMKDENLYYRKYGNSVRPPSMVKNHGYDRLFVLPSNYEVTEGMEDLDNLASDASLTKIRNTFMRSVEKRGASKAFLNRFADVIANPVTR